MDWEVLKIHVVNCCYFNIAPSVTTVTPVDIGTHMYVYHMKYKSGQVSCSGPTDFTAARNGQRASASIILRSLLVIYPILLRVSPIA